MTAQPLRGAFQPTTQTDTRQEEIISKLNELSKGIGVGANYYPGSTDPLKVRFGDHNHGASHAVLTPQEIAAVHAYMDDHDNGRANPAFNHVRALFQDADDALARARDYIREQQARQRPAATPRAIA